MCTLSRVPSPKRALAAAIPLAEKRGKIQIVRQGPEALYDFGIVSVIPIAFVSVKRAEHILASVVEIARDFHDAILRLRLVASSAAISRELWLRSKHGTWRFFLVTASGLVELDREGKPLPAGTTTG